MRNLYSQETESSIQAVCDALATGAARYGLTLLSVKTVDGPADLHREGAPQECRIAMALSPALMRRALAVDTGLLPLATFAVHIIRNGGKVSVSTVLSNGSTERLADAQLRRDLASADEALKRLITTSCAAPEAFVGALNWNMC